MKPTSPRVDHVLPLHEHKKRRVRRQLTETALRLFVDRGFEETTLDELVDAVEVSKRTFFRFFPSKEAVALAAEGELWDAYVDAVGRREIHGTVLPVLGEALTATVLAMDQDWARRFLVTQGLLEHSPSLRDRSDLISLAVQRRIVEVLESALDLDTRDNARLRILGECALGAWRCAVKNWVLQDNRTNQHRKLVGLVRHIEAAFTAIPGSLALSVP